MNQKVNRLRGSEVSKNRIKSRLDAEKDGGRAALSENGDEFFIDGIDPSLKAKGEAGAVHKVAYGSDPRLLSARNVAGTSQAAEIKPSRRRSKIRT